MKIFHLLSTAYSSFRLLVSSTLDWSSPHSDFNSQFIHIVLFTVSTASTTKKLRNNFIRIYCTFFFHARRNRLGKSEAEFWIRQISWILNYYGNRIVRWWMIVWTVNFVFAQLQSAYCNRLVESQRPTVIYSYINLFMYIYSYVICNCVFKCSREKWKAAIHISCRMY